MATEKVGIELPEGLVLEHLCEYGPDLGGRQLPQSFLGCFSGLEHDIAAGRTAHSTGA